MPFEYKIMYLMLIMKMIRIIYIYIYNYKILTNRSVGRVNNDKQDPIQYMREARSV